MGLVALTQLSPLGGGDLCVKIEVREDCARIAGEFSLVKLLSIESFGCTQEERMIADVPSLKSLVKNLSGLRVKYSWHPNRNADPLWQILFVPGSVDLLGGLGYPVSII